MKSKRLVYFEESMDQSDSKNISHSMKKSISLSKNLRDCSNPKPLVNHGQLSSSRQIDKNPANQKIKVVLTKDGFLIQKKYLVYEIQCSLTPKQQTGQPHLLLNIDTNYLSIWQGQVKYNFLIARDERSLLRVAADGYHAENISILNKRIDFIDEADCEGIDGTEMTLAEPIRLMKESLKIRQKNLNTFWAKRPHLARKNLIISESYDPNAESEARTERSQKKTSVLHNSSNFSNLSKLMGSSGFEYNPKEEKQLRRQSGAFTERTRPNRSSQEYSENNSQLVALLKDRTKNDSSSNLKTIKPFTEDSSKANADRKKENFIQVQNDYYMGAEDGRKKRVSSIAEQDNPSLAYSQDLMFSRYGLRRADEKAKKSFRF